MIRELTPIDIRRVPGLAALVDEVRRTRKPMRIVRDDTDIAVIMPAPTVNRRRLRDWRPNPEDVEAALATFGSWKDHIDPEEFKRQRRELQVDDKPPRTL
ncbi:MAG: hypothetical protein ACRDJE_02300 [Dehalococcoidia bacterium]